MSGPYLVLRVGILVAIVGTFAAAIWRHLSP